jgi:hypothetical protein
MKGFPPDDPIATCPIFLLNPNLSTICLATRETCIKSLEAPVVTLFVPKITSSATLQNMCRHVKHTSHHFAIEQHQVDAYINKSFMQFAPATKGNSHLVL